MASWCLSRNKVFGKELRRHWKQARPWHSPASLACPHHPWVGRPSRRWSQCSRWRHSSQLSRPSTWNLSRPKMCTFPPLRCKDVRVSKILNKRESRTSAVNHVPKMKSCHHQAFSPNFLSGIAMTNQTTCRQSQPSIQVNQYWGCWGCQRLLLSWVRPTYHSLPGPHRRPSMFKKVSLIW